MSSIIWNKNTTGNRTAWGSYLSPSSPSFPSPFEFILIFAKDTKKKKGSKDKITVGRDDFIKSSCGMWSGAPETRQSVRLRSLSGRAPLLPAQTHSARCVDARRAIFRCPFETGRSSHEPLIGSALKATAKLPCRLRRHPFRHRGDSPRPRAGWEHPRRRFRPRA